MSHMWKACGRKQNHQQQMKKEELNDLLHKLIARGISPLLKILCPHQVGIRSITFFKCLINAKSSELDNTMQLTFILKSQGITVSPLSYNRCCDHLYQVRMIVDRQNMQFDYIVHGQNLFDLRYYHKLYNSLKAYLGKLSLLVKH